MASTLSPPEDILLYYEGTSELNPPKPFKTTKLLYQDAGDGVFVITMNDPKRLNCLSKDLARQFPLVLEHVKRDTRCKVVVWTGAGRAFCAGGNFTDTSSTVPDEVYQAYVNAGVAKPEPDNSASAATSAMIKLPKISIAAVNGIAVGGGVNIAFTWQDFVYAAKEAWFRYPFAELGVTPELGSSVVLARMIGLSKAKVLLQMGKQITAEQAHDLGLVTEVAPAADVLQVALTAAKRLAALPQLALSESKRLLNAELAGMIDRVTADELATFLKAQVSPETQKAMKALEAKTAKPPKAKL